MALTPLPTPWLRRWLGRFNGPGLATAVLLFVLTLGPALTPRPGLYQGVSAGVCAAIGYGLGAGAAALSRWLPARMKPTARWRRRGWWLLTVVGPLAVLGGLIWSATWQRQLSTLMGMDPAGATDSIRTVTAAVLTWLFLVLVARGIRVTVRSTARLVGRWLPPMASSLAAVAVVATAAVLLFNGVGVRIVRSVLESSFAALDHETFPSSVQPIAPERSGSVASTQLWNTLGREGRRFVSTGPTVADLAAFDQAIGVDRQVREPIRVYAGRTSADTVAEVAANVVAELDRTGAWDRSVLVVTTTTGTGWVDPAGARAVELLWGGDTAIAAMQYSYLPSWVSFVGDRASPVEAGTALFEAVRTRWEQLPADERPLLEVTGISLGSFGSQGAFSSLDEVLERTDGAVWVGTPHFTPLWSGLEAARDPGSRQIDPVLDSGRQVRWGASSGCADEELFALGHDWPPPRVVYLQHPSDGVVWWSPDLIVSEPDWLREPRGSDVLATVHWVPVVSFWQLTVDLFVAGEAPPGHGHHYTVEYADGWAAVAAPPGWTDGDTTALRAAVAHNALR